MSALVAAATAAAAAKGSRGNNSSSSSSSSKSLVSWDPQVPVQPELINVFVVERPYLTQDGRNPTKDITLVGRDTVELLVADMSSAASKTKFEVAQAFPMLTRVESVFNTSVHRLVEHAVLGYNAVALCVGASDHGKSELFGGGLPIGGPENPDPSAQKGLVGLGLEDLWDMLESTAAQFKQAKRRYQYKVQVGCFEAYDEKITDLLTDDAEDLPIVNDPEIGYCVAGLSTQLVGSAAAALEVFQRSSLKRQSNMSDYDSVPPSHDATYFLEVQLEQYFDRNVSNPAMGGAITTEHEFLKSRLHFCELAGTEVLAHLSGGQVRIATQRKQSLSQGVLSVKAVADQVGSTGASSAGSPRGAGSLGGALGSGKALTRSNGGGGRHWESDFTTFSQSVVTKLLQQALGGNSVTACVASLMQGGAEGNVATMQLLCSLARVHCCPLPYSPRAALLLRRMRVNILRLEDQLEAFRLLSDKSKLRTGATGTDTDGAADGEAANDMQVAKLKEKSLELQIRLKELQHSRDTVQHELDHMRISYEKLVDKKSHMQEDFIHAEEEKLQISKALLDLQIENNQLKERLDRGQYDVDSKMLTLEHEMIEMQVERDALTEKHKGMEADLKEAAVELRDLQEEYITLRTNYINLTKEFNDAKQKNENINAEFLSLVNKTNLLEEKNKELTLERDNLAREGEASKRTASILEIENSKAVDEARDLRAAVIQLEAQKLNLEAHLKAQGVEFEEERLRMEQDSIGKSLAQEGDLLSRQRGLQNEQSRYTTENSMLQQALDQAQGQLRSSERKRRAAEQATDDAIAECNRWKAKYHDSEATLADKTAAYQRQLVTYVIGNDTENHWFQEVGQHLFSEEGKQQLVHTGKLRPPSQAMIRQVDPRDNDEASIPGRAVHEMVTVHDSTIGRMKAQLRKAEQDADDARRNARSLRQAYTALFNQLQDLGPAAAGVDVPPLEETLRGTATVEKSSSDLELQDREDRLQKLTRTLEHECETRVQEAAKFVRDRARLEEQIRLLEAKLEAGGGSGANDSQKPPEDVSPQVNKLMELQQELMKKLDELQAGVANTKASNSEEEAKSESAIVEAPKKKRKDKSETEAEVENENADGHAMSEELAEKDAQIAKLKKQLASMRKKLKAAKAKAKKPAAKAGGGKKAKSGYDDSEIPEHDAWEMKVKGLEAKLTSLQAEYDSLLDRLEQGLAQNGKEDISKTLRSAESRAAQGMTKYTMAEAELNNYKQFMAKTIKGYNKKIADLKKRIQ